MANVPLVLVIDDDKIANVYLCQVLQNAGYVVMSAFDGLEGLNKVFQVRPSCIVLDVVLPGASGFEVCRRIRTSPLSPQPAIIMVSGKNSAPDLAWGMRMGATRYLPKPFAEEVLLKAVQELAPLRTRQTTTPMNALKSSAVSQSADLTKCIPRLRKDDGLMWAANPHIALIKDKQARLLYLAIDGRRNVEKLCAITGMNVKELSAALQVLLIQKRIELCDAQGRVLNTESLFHL